MYVCMCVKGLQKVLQFFEHSGGGRGCREPNLNCSSCLFRLKTLKIRSKQNVTNVKYATGCETSNVHKQTARGEGLISPILISPDGY